MSKDVDLSTDEISILEQMAATPACKIVTHPTKPARLCGMTITASGAMVKVDQAVDKMLVHTLTKAGLIAREDAGPVLVITAKGASALKPMGLRRVG
jgi:hypothetical protein